MRVSAVRPCALAGVCIGLLLCLFPEIVAAQSVPVGPPEAEESDVRGLLVFRISESFLRREFQQEIHRQSPVDRTVLGTRNRGTTQTVAKMEITTRSHDDELAFNVVARGKVDSYTTGHNGPAVIRSHSQTPFTATIPVQFDGSAFRRGPLALAADTHVRILCVDSTLPGLRRRIVTNVARRRLDERLPQVRAVSAALTENELRKSIGASMDDAIERLNQRLQVRQLLSFISGTAEGRWLRYSSSTDSLCIAWYPLLFANEVPRCPLEESGSAEMQLWIHGQVATALQIDRLPEIGENFAVWVGLLIPKAPLIEALPLRAAIPLPPIGLRRVDDWVVVEFQASEQ